ncbi:UrcA family protein [Sphingomonas parva]|nr:UrcA family protein [Sphingomonas parva]
MRRFLPLVSLGAFMILAPNAGSAAQAQQSATVSYADLDLSRPAGTAELDRRIGVAVRSLCGTASAADPKGRQNIRRCRADAHSAVAQQRAQAIASSRQEPNLASIR